jgi:hypothetical protein
MVAMPLHESLRDLVAMRGARIVDDAEEFRGALDDFLAEDEATFGEINLLVDTVRLGALRRVLAVLAHGAAPEAAVREAGAALARDRGTDDPTRSCWALAILCFALERVEEAMVLSFLDDTGTTPMPEPEHPEPDHPEPDHPEPDHPEPDQAEPEPPAVALTAPAVGGDDTRAAPAGGSTVTSRRPVARPLVVLVLALVVGGLAAAAVVLLRPDSDETTTSDSDGQGGAPLLVAAYDEMIVPFHAGYGSALYRVSATDRGYHTITDGTFDIDPALSPDRLTMTYSQGPPPLRLMRWDVATGSAEPFFDLAGPCANAWRPGWSPDGSRIAVICTGDDAIPEGIFVAAADGARPTLVVPSALVRGAPTWTSDSRFMFRVKAAAGLDDERDLRLVDVDIGGNPVPVATPAGVVSHVDWSKEADKVLFLLSPAGEDEVGDIWTMNADGTGQEVLAAGQYADPVWSPDGTSIGLAVVDETGRRALAVLLVDHPDAPMVLEHVPAGEPGAAVWGTR